MNVGGERVYTYSITSAIDRIKESSNLSSTFITIQFKQLKILLENMDND